MCDCYRREHCRHCCECSCHKYADGGPVKKAQNRAERHKFEESVREAEALAFVEALPTGGVLVTTADGTTHRMGSSDTMTIWRSARTWGA